MQPGERGPSLDRVRLPDLDALADLVADGGVVVLSGAGLSTESGIPDYRGPTGVARGGTPMTFQVFTGDPLAQQRYWARSHVGWRTIARAEPNDGHRAVAALQEQGLLSGVITQNVDGLHQAAGARGVVELHGALDRVVCLDCGDRTSRERARPAHAGGQPRLARAGDGGQARRRRRARRRGGRPLRRAALRPLRAGGSSPTSSSSARPSRADRVAHCFALVDAASALLVLGSSLKVMSGYRFVLRAAKLGIPVAIVNQGVTRGDGCASVRVDAPLGRVLPELVHRLPLRA